MKKDKKGEDKLTYVPLSKNNLVSITNLVKSSIGFNPKRGDDVSVSNFQFNVSNTTEHTLTPVNKVTMMISQYVGPFEPILKYLFLAIILFIFYKKVITPFSEKMLEIKSEEEDFTKKEISFEEEEVEDTYDKLKELKSKVEQQLGINNEINQEDLKYDVLLERIKDMAEEKTEEFASVLQSLLKESEEHKKG
jgi:flagellar M-ring protein FliF